MLLWFVRILTYDKVCQTTDMRQEQDRDRVQNRDRVDLDASVGYRLKQAASALRTAMDTVLRPLGITVPQYSCLELLSQWPGLSNSELARGAFVTRQSMNVLLQGLERDGLVSRPDQAPSGRVLPTELTASGRKKLRAASAVVKGVEDQMNAGLTQADHDQLLILLASCVGALSPKDQPVGDLDQR